MRVPINFEEGFNTAYLTAITENPRVDVFNCYEGDAVVRYIEKPIEVGDILFLKERYIINKPDPATPEVISGMYLDKQPFIIVERDQKRRNRLLKDTGKERNANSMQPSISRLFIKVNTLTAVRLHDLNSQDFIMEGLSLESGYGTLDTYIKKMGLYKVLWNERYKPRRFRWEVNPWCWLFTFELFDMVEDFC
jgi:hypothetical protein